MPSNTHPHSYLPTLEQSLGLNLSFNDHFLYAPVGSQFDDENGLQKPYNTDGYSVDTAQLWPSFGSRSSTPKPAPSTHMQPTYDPSINPAYLNAPLQTMPPSAPGSPFYAPSPASDTSDNVFSSPSCSARPNLAASPAVTFALPILDFDDMLEDDNDDDGEWCPPSTRSTPARKRGGRQSAAAKRRARSDSPVAKKPVRKTPYNIRKRQRNPPPSRVFQMHGPGAEEMKRAITTKGFAIEATYGFECPAERCEYRMRGKSRVPDFKRHMGAHLREAYPELFDIACKGITLEEFQELSEMEKETVRNATDHDGSPFQWRGGEWRIGGCQRTFSRGDALTRHLKGRSGCMRIH